MLASIERRWPSYEYNTTYAIATVVDPRYKDCGFNNSAAAANAEELVVNEMAYMVTVMQSEDGSNANLHTPTTSGTCIWHAIWTIRLGCVAYGSQVHHRGNYPKKSHFYTPAIDKSFIVIYSFIY
jgi:hypothetical protein